MFFGFRAFQSTFLEDVSRPNAISVRATRGRFWKKEKKSPVRVCSRLGTEPRSAAQVNRGVLAEEASPIERPRPPKGRPSRASLPPGWEEYTDPSTKKAYYHNLSTGEVTWERPPAGVAPPPPVAPPPLVEVDEVALPKYW